MENTLIFLQKLLNITTGTPLSAISFDKKALAAFMQNSTGTAYDDANPIWERLLRTRNNALCEWDSYDGVAFLLIPLRVRNMILILGPVATTSAEHHTLRQIGELIAEHLSVYDDSSAIPADTPLIRHHHFTGEDIAQMRQVEQRYEYSAALTNAIQQGNLSLALHLIGHYDPSSQTAVRNANPLRNAQNYCIVLNTQLRHALEESGIHPYQVDRLSNEIGLEIEQLKNISQLPDFFSSVIRRYCRLVQEHAYPNLRPLSNLAVTYIKEHLADNLTVKDTAKALTVNANYLSSLFHKDMGMTFIDFVNKERTNQAAALLKHTNLQIQQIASTVGYNNTSYFAKQFLRFQGESPSQYRREI